MIELWCGFFTKNRVVFSMYTKIWCRRGLIRPHLCRNPLFIVPSAVLQIDFLLSHRLLVHIWLMLTSWVAQVCAIWIQDGSHGNFAVFVLDWRCYSQPYKCVHWISAGAYRNFEVFVLGFGHQFATASVFAMNCCRHKLQPRSNCCGAHSKLRRGPFVTIKLVASRQNAPNGCLWTLCGTVGADHIVAIKIKNYVSVFTTTHPDLPSAEREAPVNPCCPKFENSG